MFIVLGNYIVCIQKSQKKQQYTQSLRIYVFSQGEIKVRICVEVADRSERGSYIISVILCMNGIEDDCVLSFERGQRGGVTCRVFYGYNEVEVKVCLYECVCVLFMCKCLHLI
eukprot:TRINITY_DN6635_c0_g1_i1.p10 TRINITY_DN6635_c0_g1~~TRINITY_DN6635_c0_g1_i1.p10  ORF type:complete len:113 (-),score=2.59 TRINITY_DN6635_c0_g1_i1:85-423(-)